jgi:hypothetical protein
MTYLIQHFTLALLEKGLIDRELSPELYRQALLAQGKIREVMFDLARELVVDPDRGVIGIRNFTEAQEDDFLARAGDDAQALPSHNRATLSFYESAALFHLFRHQATNQTLTEAGTWMRHENIVELLLGIFAQRYRNNASLVEKQIKSILQKLKTFGLVEDREADGVTWWRGTRYLPIVLTPDVANEFERSLEFLKAQLEERGRIEEEPETPEPDLFNRPEGDDK